MRCIVPLFALAVLPLGPALAADTTGFYVGGDVGNSTEHFYNSTFGVNADDTGYKVAAGIRPLSVLAGEVDYVSEQSFYMAGPIEDVLERYQKAQN